MERGGARATIHLLGAFRFLGGAGADITPRGKKTQALLALLAASPQGRRSRRWLEATLWSDRDQEQAGASLRQTLTTLRRIVKDDPELLEIGRDFVMLNLDVVAVDLYAAPEGVRAALRSGEQILEGLDIRDEAFEEWLTVFRSSWLDAAVENPPLAPAQDAPEDKAAVRLSVTAAETPIAGMIADFILERIGLDLQSTYALEVVTGDGGAADLILSATVIDEGGLRHVKLAIRSSERGRLIWSRALILPMAVDFRQDPDLQEAIFLAAEVCADNSVLLGSDGARAHRLGALMTGGLDELFTFDAARLEVADRLVVAADAIVASPAIDAWRSMIKATMYVERAGVDLEALREESLALGVKAIEASPYDPRILSVAGLVMMLSGNDADLGGGSADAAVRQNPGDAIGRLGLAVALLRNGRAAEAMRQAQMARRIARSSRFRHWWDMFCCLAEISVGDFKSATESAEAALEAAPSFVPPMRHLYPLYMHAGRTEDAKRVLSRLRRHDPTFSMERVRGDDSYPAGTLRGTALGKMPDL